MTTPLRASGRGETLPEREDDERQAAEDAEAPETGVVDPLTGPPVPGPGPDDVRSRSAA